MQRKAQVMPRNDLPEFTTVSQVTAYVGGMRSVCPENTEYWRGFRDALDIILKRLEESKTNA